MEDKAELDAAGTIIRDVGRELLRRNSGVVQEVLQLFLNHYDEWKISKEFSVFLVCFSDARDKESQWKQYADDGRDVCLGLKMLRGEEQPEEVKGMGRGMVRVDYDPESWTRTTTFAFERVCAELRRIARSAGSAEQKVAATHVGSALFRIAAFSETVGKLCWHWVGPREAILFRRKQFWDGAIFDLGMMFLALKTLF
jgi:hypothetical protein